MPLPVIALALLFARWQRFDRLTVAFLLAAIALCYFQFYTSLWTEFAPDAYAHAQYIRYLAEHGSLPSPGKDAGMPAARHPPTYYLMAALFYWLGEATHYPDPLQIARHLSMFLYVFFLLTGIRFLQLVLRPSGTPYYAALALLLFWPVGVTMGGRLNCDLLLYAAEMGALYSLTRYWQDEKDTRQLSYAFIWSAVAVLAKNMGVLVFGMSMLLALKKRNLSRFLKWEVTGFALAVLLICAATFSRNWVTTNIQAHPYDWDAWWQMVRSFSPYLLLFDTEMMDSQGSFWNVMLHAFALGDPTMPWKYFHIPVILIACNILWSAILIYLILGLLSLWRTLTPDEKKPLILMGVFALCSVAAMLGLLLITGNIAYADARYMYPLVAGVALAHGRIMEGYKRAGRADIYRIGLGLAGGFALLTFVLFLAQHLPLESGVCHSARRWAPC